AEQLRACGELERELVARFPDGFLALTILPTSDVRLTADVRAEAERLASGLSDSVRALAQVIEDDGFVAAAVRSVTFALSLLSPQRKKMRIFRDVEDAAEW